MNVCRNIVVKKNILIIEDNPDNQVLVEEILEDAGFNSVSVSYAEEGISRLHQGGIDLVLMDVSLPDIDGLEATRIIRRDVRFKTLPIIGLSAHAMERDREAALLAGCNDYQTKPIREADLLSLITSVLKMKKI